MTARVRHARGILDTSTVILLGRLDDPSLLPDEPLITAITLAELTVGPLVATTDHERAARQAHLQQAESDFDALPSTPVPPGPPVASSRRFDSRGASRSPDRMMR